MRFEKPVSVATGPAGNVRLLVQDAQRAAAFLQEEFPRERRGEAWREACRAVLAAHDADYPTELVETARRAFACAADEADILMPDAPKPDPIPGFKSPSWRKKRR